MKIKVAAAQVLLQMLWTIGYLLVIVGLIAAEFHFTELNMPSKYLVH